MKVVLGSPEIVEAALGLSYGFHALVHSLWAWVASAATGAAFGFSLKMRSAAATDLTTTLISSSSDPHTHHQIKSQGQNEDDPTTYSSKSSPLELEDPNHYHDLGGVHYHQLSSKGNKFTLYYLKDQDDHNNGDDSNSSDSQKKMQSREVVDDCGGGHREIQKKSVFVEEEEDHYYYYYMQTNHGHDRRCAQVLELKDRGCERAPAWYACLDLRFINGSVVRFYGMEPPPAIHNTTSYS